MKLTAWYAGNQKPARVGVYQRQYTQGIFYCHWDGKFWGVGFKENNWATVPTSKRFPSSMNSLRWRGVAK